MIWKSRHGAEADLPWSRIAGWIGPGLILGAVFLSGGGRRVVIGLYHRHLQDRIASAGLDSLRASATAMIGTSDPSTATVAQTAAHADATSNAGPPLNAGPSVPLGGATPSTGTSVILGDVPTILAGQPLIFGSAVAESGLDRADSVVADGSTSCPAEFPIKGNGRSGIYHLPRAFTYDRTVPSICFRTVEAAERAGFRAARFHRS
jgi:hypothetical protein